MALTGEREDSTVVHEAIDESRCRHLVGKDLSPFFKRQIACQCDALSFVSLRDELEQQVSIVATSFRGSQVHSWK